MDNFARLDVSVKETSVCIVDDTSKTIREVKVASEPEALLAVLNTPAYHFKRIGLEADPLSQWLFSALAEAGLPMICVETRHMRAVLKAQINKTYRNDARGIAQMMRVGLYRPVHVKTRYAARADVAGPPQTAAVKESVFGRGWVRIRSLVCGQTPWRDHATNRRAGDCLYWHSTATFPGNWRYNGA
jgi:hypothetical protein